MFVGFHNTQIAPVEGPIRQAFRNFPTKWKPMIETPVGQAVVNQICSVLDQPQHIGTYNPPPADLFTALEHVPPESVRVVCFGQDPYPGSTYAHGVAFSCRMGSGVAQSLKNIGNGLRRIEPTYPHLTHGCLTSWEQQGVLLLNVAFTVRKSDAGLQKDKHLEENHRECWRPLLKLITDYLQELENARMEWARSQGMVAPRIVYAAFGRSAQAVLESLPAVHKYMTGHPSARNLTRDFDANIFVQINAALMTQNQNGIDWRVV